MKKNVPAKRFFKEGKVLSKYLVRDFLNGKNFAFINTFFSKGSPLPPHFHIMQQNCNNSP